MCRTAHALLQTVICGIQMLVRVFMTVILMIENLIRMVLQTLYNFISFLLQMISLIPICLVFMLTARLKCFMCGGGGPCPVNRGGTCDCLMSAVAIIILFLIFRATGVLDKIFYKLGYVKARPLTFTRFVPTPGDITECSRNDSFYDNYNMSFTAPDNFTDMPEVDSDFVDISETMKQPETTRKMESTEPTRTVPTTKTTTVEPEPEVAPGPEPEQDTEAEPDQRRFGDDSYSNWTTVLYYLV